MAGGLMYRYRAASTVADDGRLLGAASIAAVLLLSLSACGGDDDRADTVPTPSTVTASTAPTTTTEPPAAKSSLTAAPAASTIETTAAPATTAVATTVTATEPPTNGLSVDPASVVPTLDDLPAGWSPEPNEEDEAEGTDCLSVLFDGLGIGMEGESLTPHVGTAAFSQSEFGPFLSTAVVVDSGVDMDVLFDGLAPGFAECDGTTDDDGNTSTILPMSFPQIGEDTFAARVDISSEMVPLSMQYVLARSDDSVVMTAYVAIGGLPDASLLESVTRLMIDRL